MASILQKPSSRQQPLSLLSLISLLCFVSPSTSLPQQLTSPTTTSSPPSATSASPSTLPGYASTSSSGSGGISNYYFIIIGVGIVVLLIIFWVLVRRRTAAIARTMPRDAEAATTDQRTSRRWPMPMPALARWIPIRSDRTEEGLDERGEAPPPYMPGQTLPPAHLEGQVHHPVTGEPIPLAEFSGKPPDYDDESASGSEVDLTRPAQAHIPTERNTMERPVMETAESSERGAGTRNSGTPGTSSNETEMSEHAEHTSEVRSTNDAEPAPATRSTEPPEPSFVANLAQSLRTSGLGKSGRSPPVTNHEQNTQSTEASASIPEHEESESHS